MCHWFLGLQLGIDLHRKKNWFNQNINLFKLRCVHRIFRKLKPELCFLLCFNIRSIFTQLFCSNCIFESASFTFLSACFFVCFIVLSCDEHRRGDRKWRCLCHSHHNMWPMLYGSMCCCYFYSFVVVVAFCFVLALHMSCALVYLPSFRTWGLSHELRSGKQKKTHENTAKKKKKKHCHISYVLSTKSTRASAYVTNERANESGAGAGAAVAGSGGGVWIRYESSWLKEER